MKNEHQFLFIALSLVALSIGGCQEVVEDTTTNPVPVSYQESNITAPGEETVDLVVVSENSVNDQLNSSVEAADSALETVNPSTTTESYEAPVVETNPVETVLNTVSEDSDSNLPINDDVVSQLPSNELTNEAQNCSDVLESELIGAAASLNDSADITASLLQTSQSLLSLSNSMTQSGIYSNIAYVSAMYALSQDVSTMASRIGEMSDRIILMSDEIAQMSDRIVLTQTIQDENLAKTQENITKAQANFTSLLKLR